MSDHDYAKMFGGASRVFILLACDACLVEITKHAAVIGSLMKPRRDAEEFFRRVYHKDPPEFHTWLTDELLRYIHLRADRGDRAGVVAFLGEDK